MYINDMVSRGQNFHFTENENLKRFCKRAFYRYANDFKLA